MNRDLREHPLFWEPEEEFQRCNEWCEPKVFAFGDMDILEEKDLGKIADNYFKCADLLIERVLKNGIEDFVAQFPILYLLRHAVEIRLKQIVLAQTGKPAVKTHRLGALAEKTDGIAPWALERIRELDAIDPKAVCLRYGGVGERAPTFIGTEVRFFHDAMHVLRDHLRAVAGNAQAEAES